MICVHPFAYFAGDMGSFSSLEMWVAAAQVEKTDIRSHDDFKKCLQTMVSYEWFITNRFITKTSGSVFRLLADGRKRVYQVEIGSILWKFPAALEPVRADYRVAVSAANVRSGLL